MVPLVQMILLSQNISVCHVYTHNNIDQTFDLIWSCFKISDSKLVSFAVGQQKKSRFHKSREEKEIKRKEEDKEAAKVYESFVASFADESSEKTFVRSGGSDYYRAKDQYKDKRPHNDPIIGSGSIIDSSLNNIKIDNKSNLSLRTT